MIENNLQEDNARKILNRVGLMMFLVEVSVLVSGSVFSFIFQWTCQDIFKKNWFTVVLTAIIMIGVALPILCICSRKIPDSEYGAVKKLGFKRFITIFLISLAFMYISNYITALLSYFLGMVKGESLTDPVKDIVLNGNWVLTLIYTAMVAPVLEETIFRKILLDKVRRFGELPAILITSIAFGLFHTNFLQLIYATALGIVFAYVTLKTNTIRYSILMHVMINLIGGTIAPFAITSKNKVWSYILVVWLMAAMTAGILLFIRNRKKIVFVKSEITGLKVNDYIFNYGTMLYVVICLIVIILNIL
jgi:membrane protease YdiL (CAAX protease family)